MAVDRLIQCPSCKMPLRKATEVELDLLRSLQATGNLFNRLGRKIEIPLTDGYVSDESQNFYCVVNEVVWLVAEEAIPLR